MGTASPLSSSEACNIAGIALSEIVGGGAHSVVYRGRQGERDVAVKVARVTEGADAHVVRRAFLREAASLSRIHHEGVVSVLGSGTDSEGRSYMVLEHLCGETLAQHIARTGKLAVAEVLSLARRLAAALAAVHQHGLVHRDVKPANIMLLPSGAPKLIDFGLVGEHRDGASGQVVGTFLYAAPEQNGRLKRNVDGRADLYALGVVLYECLVGEPPFLGPDLESVIHMHATEKPRSLSSRREDVSETLSAIVDKLLAKDPDDRYQTARSLLHDLEHVVELRPDKLGREHVEPRLEALLPLTGRSEIMGKLVSHLQSAAQGRGSVAVLASRRGQGKSRVLAELERRATAGGGLTLSLARAAHGEAPLAPFRGVLERLALRLATMPEADRATFRLRLVQAAGDYAPYLSALIPALRPVLGQAAVLPSSDVGSELLYDAIAHTLAGLSERYAVGLLVVEDAECLDSASLKVLRRLSHRAKDTHFLMVCAVEGDGLALHEELARHLEGHVDAEIVLGSLGDAELASVLDSYLGGTRIDGEVVQFIVARSHGSPRLLIELADTLMSEGAVVLREGAFRLEREALVSLSLPEDASELFLARARTLPEPQREVLRAASVLGMVFDVASLSAIAERSQPELHDLLEQLVEGRLLEHADGRRYAFVDERLRSWFYEQLDPTRRAAMHREAARLARSESGEDALFAAARHGFAGLDADTAPEAYAANLAAGTLSLARNATREAIAFLEQARRVTEAFDVTPGYELWKRLAEAYAQGGRMERSFELLARALEACRVPLERARMRMRVAELRMQANFDVGAATPELEGAYEEFGLRMPRNSPVGFLWFAFYGVVATLMDFTGFGVGMARDKARAALLFELLELTSKWAYFSNRFHVLVSLAFRMLYVGLTVGRSPAMVFAYAAHGATCANLGFPPRLEERYQRRARELARDLGDRALEVRVEYWRCVALAQRGRFLEQAAALDALLAQHSRWFDIADLFLAYVDLNLSYGHRGHASAATHVMRRCLEQISERAGDDVSEALACREVLAGAEILLSRPAEGIALLRQRLETALDPVKDSFLWFQVWYVALGVRVETFDHEHYDECIENADRAHRNPMTAGWQFGYYWVCKGIARLEQCFLATAEERQQRLAQLRETIAELKHPAKLNLFRMHRLILQAGVLFFEGAHEQALARIGEADSIAGTLDSPQGSYEALRLRSRIYGALGIEGARQRDLWTAHTIAERQGWAHRARMVRRELGTQPTSRLVDVGASDSPGGVHLAATGAAAQRVGAAQLKRDRDALLEVSLAAALVLDPIEQATVALDKLLELLGGERGFLLLWDEQEQELVKVAARGAKQTSLPASAAYPHAVVEWVRSMRAPVVLNGFDEASRMGSDTAVRLGLRSIIAAPLMVRERFVGVVQLDSMVAKGVFTEADLDILKAIANQIAVSQEAAQIAQREIERRELQKDLQLSAAVQGLLLPKQDVLFSGDIEIAGVLQPAAQVGGDYWYAEAMHDGRARILVGDVTGHGAGSAMVTAVTAGAHRALEASSSSQSVPELLAKLDRVLREVCEGKYTEPLCALEIEPSSGRVRFWSAAAPPLLVLRADGSIDSYGEKGLALGSDTLLLGEGSLELAPGESLLVFTDGVPELELSEERQLGLRRLSKMFAGTQGMTIQQARRSLLEEIEKASGEAPRSDDVTLVLVSRKP
jgi:serine phosphatase RsbU (regulator of sigma subunit)/tRNA A-37 threonylcarbamoyl transferase component Bud32